MTPRAAAASAKAAPKAGRADATARRRSQILDAALDCFVSKGYAQTTIADVRERSGASTGSIYHHFAGKEQLAAALYVEGLAHYQAGLLEVLEANADAEAGVKAVVRYHLHWVTAHRKLARYLMNRRPSGVVMATKRPMREQNRKFLSGVHGWFEPHLGAGRVARLPTDLFYSVLLGPVQEFSRNWLDERARTPLDEAADVLADATWRSVSIEKRRSK